MTRGTNFTNKRPTSRDSYKTPNYASLVPQNPQQVATQPRPTFVNAFRQNLEIDPLDPDQTIATPEEVPPNAITAARTLLAGLSGQETSHIDFYAEEPSEEQVVKARQRARAATDLITRSKPPKHNNPPAQPMLAFDQVLADLETKLLQLYRLLQGILTQIVKRKWFATLKFNLCTFISIYDMIYKVNMTRALMDTTEQGNLLTTQPSPVIRPGYNNQMLRSLRALPQTEGAHPASVDTLLTRIVGFTGELDQELKKLTAQQVIDMIRSKPEIMPPEWAQDQARKPTLETQLTAFFTTTESITTVELESIRTTEPFLQPASSTIDVWTATTTITLPILGAANAIPDLTSSVPSYPATKPLFTNDEPTVSTNERASTIKQPDRKRTTRPDLTRLIGGTGYNINNRVTTTEYNVSQECTQYVDPTNSSISTTTDSSNTTATKYNREESVVKIELEINIPNTQQS
ncbi:MAG: hypothetical protein EZS28_016239 [Streblomastix strix]|uniref:Uncharacterized protein n=1 Tax=Streblomastix strix TaxID=222440 RepID=A0A5J4VZX5_9EUKA|nr:MAG: hypothetical protein EZS28_016239 [Streblomastix strix]